MVLVLKVSRNEWYLKSGMDERGVLDGLSLLKGWNDKDGI